MAKRTIVKSDAQTDEFELDQEAIDAVNAEEGFGEDISDSDVKDALVAIAAIADEVIEEGEELEPEQVVEKVAEIVEGDDFEPETETEEVEVSEEEEMPEELNNALVRVMVQEGDEVEIDGSTVEDEIRQETIDGETATVFDTVSDSGDSFEEMDFAEDSDEADEGLIVVGNSLVKNPSYKKGFVTLKNSVQKKVGKCWSAAYKKVRAMIGSRKMNAKDWAIVSCLALSMSKKEKVASAAKANNMKRVMTAVKNNADFKAEFTKMIGSGCHGKKEEEKGKKKSIESARSSKFDRIPKELWDKVLDYAIRGLNGLYIEEGESKAKVILRLLQDGVELKSKGFDDDIVSAAMEMVDPRDSNFSTIKRYFASRFPEKWNQIYDSVTKTKKEFDDYDRNLYKLNGDSDYEDNSSYEEYLGPASRITIGVSDDGYRIDFVKDEYGHKRFELYRQGEMRSWAYNEDEANEWVSNYNINLKAPVESFINSSRCRIKSELNAEIDASSETLAESKPEETVATDFGKVNTNPDFAEGEVVEPYDDVPDVPADGTPVDDPEDLIEPGAEDVVEVAVPLESSTRRIVLKKIMNSVYKVVGTRLTSRRLVNRRPLKSGTVICLKNGKAILLKNSNTAGTLAFYGKLIKSSSKAPYCAVKTEGGVYITQNKRGSDMFALAEKRCLMNSIARARKVQSSRTAESRLARRRSLMNVLRDRKAKELKSARLARLEKIRNSRVPSSELKNEKLQTLKNSRLIQSKNEQISALKSELVKAKIQSIKSRKDSQKVTEMVAKQERDRLFQSNKEQLSNIAKIDQINSSKNVDTMASMLDRMF